MDKLLFKKILVSILTLCLICYVIYLFAGLNSKGSLETETAIYTTVSDVIDSKGFIVRNETLVNNNNDAVLSYNVFDGENVSVGQKIADVYSSEFDAVARKEIKELDKRIEDLRKLATSHFQDSVGLDTVNNLIETELFSMLACVNKENYSDADSDGKDLLYYINERQIITGQVENFDSKITQLKKEKASLEAKCSPKIDSIVAKDAGYFISDIDNYEKAFDYKEISKVTLEEFNAVKKKNYTNEYIGKIVVNPEWYVLCEINKDDALALSKMQGQGLDVNISIPFITTQKIPAKIIAVNQKTRQDDGVLILSCDYMNDDISKARYEDVEIETSFHEGIKVAKRAIKEDYVYKTVKKGDEILEKKKKVQGVYVVYGSELKFKEIDIVYSEKDYVVCNPTPDDNILFNGETIKLYDRVVIKGDNLYDGKIV